MPRVERSPPPLETRGITIEEQEDNMEINELRRTLAEQQQVIELLQQQQQLVGQNQNQNQNQNNGILITEGNLAQFSIRDALEAIPNYDGENIAFVYFVEGCEEALSMIIPIQENVLVRAVRNKLKGDAHKSILGQTFNNMRELIEFLRIKYGPRETVYEAQGRLAYLYQKKDEKVSAYANRVRELGKRIFDAQRRETGQISEEFQRSMKSNLKTSFLRGLNKDLIISKEGTFEEVESRAIDAEKELETVNMIRRIVLAENTTTEKRAPIRHIDAEEIKCQFCHKIGHTADRCRQIQYQKEQTNFRSNNSNYQNNFRNSNNFNNPNNYNNPNNHNFVPNPSMNKFTPKNFQQPNQQFNFKQFKSNPYIGSLQGNSNFNQPSTSHMQSNQINMIKFCRYCKKTGHLIEECRKRLYNNNNNIQMMQNQGNGQNPERNGATSGEMNMRPTQVISVEENMSSEQ